MNLAEDNRSVDTVVEDVVLEDLIVVAQTV
jgi:hypothetical protein